MCLLNPLQKAFEQASSYQVTKTSTPEAIRDFLKGSGLVPALLTLIYVGNAYRQAGRPRTIPIEMILPGILAVYGIAQIFLPKCAGCKDAWKQYAFVGGLVGLALSIIGSQLKLPQLLFGMDANRAHVVAVAGYAVLYATWVRYWNTVASPVSIQQSNVRSSRIALRR